MCTFQVFANVSVNVGPSLHSEKTVSIIVVNSIPT